MDGHQEWCQEKCGKGSGKKENVIISDFRGKLFEIQKEYNYIYIFENLFYKS